MSISPVLSRVVFAVAAVLSMAVGNLIRGLANQWLSPLGHGQRRLDHITGHNWILLVVLGQLPLWALVGPGLASRYGTTEIMASFVLAFVLAAGCWVWALFTLRHVCEYRDHQNPPGQCESARRKVDHLGEILFVSFAVTFVGSTLL